MLTPKEMKHIKDALIVLCQDSCCLQSLGTTVPEPYIPYVPEGWNRTLVLAEAQNHAAGTYLSRLLALSKHNRVIRLSLDEKLGIQPWDDGCLKIAVRATLGLMPETTAVSNAVLWSLVNAKGTNANPSKELINQSTLLWSKMLDILKPERVVTAGRVAEKIVKCAAKKCKVQFKHEVWPLPSPRVLRPLLGYMNEKILLRHYPEISRIKNDVSRWVTEPKREKAIFYATLAINATNSV